MHAYYSLSACRNLFRPGLWIALAAGLLLGDAARAATITNITLVNVTPSTFTVLWRGAEGVPSLAVYSDPLGQTNLAGQLGIEAFPLHTGSPDLQQGYERRQNMAAIRQKSRSSGLLQVRVSGCRPNTTYYYRLLTPSGGGGVVEYPQSGPLPSVTTPRANSLVVNSQQIVIDVPGLDTLGRVVTITHSNAAWALASVVGDGASPSQAWFSLSDLFDLAGNGNFAPLGPQEFTAHLVPTAGQAEVSLDFTINFGGGFQVGNLSSATFGIEFLALHAGTNILRAGEIGTLPISLNCNVGVRSIRADLRLATDRLQSLQLTNLPSSVQTATITPQSLTNALLVIDCAPGQSLQGQITLANLRYTAVPGQSSAFVPVQWRSLTVTKADNAPLENRLASNGRVVVIGPEPLLEVDGTLDGFQKLNLYGRPWSAYAVQASTNLLSSSYWFQIHRFPMTNFTRTFLGLDAETRNAFYRAYELPGDPPIIETRESAGPGKSLLVYGQPGAQYTVQSATNIPSVNWKPVMTYTLTNAFKVLDGVAITNPIIFLRLEKKP